MLAKIFARIERTTDLYALLEESPDLITSELEPILESTRQYSALCRLYQKCGNDLKLLETWSKYAVATPLVIFDFTRFS